MQEPAVIPFGMPEKDGYILIWARKDKVNDLVNEPIDKDIKLMPWADVSYTQEFADKTSIAATSAATNGDFQSTKGKARKVLSAGTGVNAAVTSNLNLNSGIYTSAGDISKDISIRLGVNYNF